MVRTEFEELHNSEAIILHFTDGSILGIETGSNVFNLANDHEVTGLVPKYFCVDFRLEWVPALKSEGQSGDEDTY
jgi:hypothetical protein